jgi:glycosyltransferase involved in cell wall biosynthesis
VRIYRTLRRVDADVIVTRVAGPHVGLVGLSAKLARRRFVQSAANISDFDFGQLSPKRRDMLLYRLGMWLADTIVVQTEEQVPLCESVFGKRPALIKSIAESASASAVPRMALLWIGRLVWYKRPLEYVELARALPDVRFRMIGVPSTAEPELAHAVASAAADVPNLELLPPRTRPELLDALDGSVAVVNTADFEGMPNIFLEAWARGIPALALTHDPGGVIERHGLGRFAHGSADQLRRAAAELWATRDDASELANACRRYVDERHGATVIAEQWLGALGHRSAAARPGAMPEVART